MQTSSAGDGAAAVPTWFRQAVSAPREHRFTSVDGCVISYWLWGPVGRLGLVLMHGGGAHAGWWDHIAPWLVSEERSVVAIDLSGHGDSCHRDSYSLDRWAAEVLAVVSDSALQQPLLVGHSLGGWSAVVAAADHPEAVAGLVLIDCRVIDPPTGTGGSPPERPPVRSPRLYATLDDAVSRYRPDPPQEGNLPFVMDHLAVASARHVEGGWRWKFDPSAIYQRRPGEQALRRVRCPAAMIRGERGLVTAEIVEATRRALGGHLPVVDVPLAGHHLMLDQPLMLVTALRAVLAGWPDPA
jgi:pimeloyl-ACP methyl ester carboxylesterase